MTHTFSFNDAASPSSSREVSPTTTTPPPADFVGEVKKQGFVEKASKLFGTWKPRYLRLSDRTVSYSDNEDTRAKGTMMIERVERTAETVAQFNTPRDMYSLILFGGSKERWVVRCQNERDFFEWYSALRCALATARLAAPVIDGLVDHRVGLPLARVPLTHLCNFGALDEAAIYCFVPVLPFPPIAEKKVKGGMRSGAVFMDDRCLFQCSGDGSVLKCVELRNVECVMHAPCRSGGLLVGVKCARPHPDLAFILYENCDLERFLHVVKAVCDAMKERACPELSIEPSIQCVLESNVQTKQPPDYQVRILVPRTKQSLSEHLSKHDSCARCCGSAASPPSASPRRDSMESLQSTPQHEPLVPNAAGSPMLQVPANDDIAASVDSNIQNIPVNQDAASGVHKAASQDRSVFSIPHAPVPAAAALPTTKSQTMSTLLASIGLQQYERTLRRRGVDIDVLQLATPIDLLHWGVAHSSHRQQILDAVRKMDDYVLLSPPSSVTDTFRDNGSFGLLSSSPTNLVLGYYHTKSSKSILQDSMDATTQEASPEPSNLSFQL